MTTSSGRQEPAQQPATEQAALVMLSNFGRSDGGRETWAYQFIPRLLERRPALRLSLVGLRVAHEPDSAADLLAALPVRARKRLELNFLQAASGRLPNALHFAVGLRRLLGRRRDFAPAYVLAVGSVVELLAVLASKAFRDTAKILWLRTIFVDEKAHRIPASLRRLARRMEDQVLGRADLLIANGEDTADHYRRRGHRVEVIRNAVDLSRWKMPVPDFAARPLRIAYIGRLARHKGIREFVALAERMAGTGAEFHVVGHGPEEELVRSAAGRNLLVFHGAVANDALPALLANFQVCVALTFKSSEGGTSGVSNALLEQMAAGRAIVAWRSAIFEQLLDDNSAYLPKQGALSELQDAMTSILSNPFEAQRRAQMGQKIALRNGFEEHMERFEHLLAQRVLTA